MIQIYNGVPGNIYVIELYYKINGDLDTQKCSWTKTNGHYYNYVLFVKIFFVCCACPVHEMTYQFLIINHIITKQ